MRLWIAILFLLFAADAFGADLDAASCRIAVASKVCNGKTCKIATSWGSGTLIAPNRVLTCSHLFDDGGSSLTVYFAGKPYKALLIKRDKAADLALLHVYDTNDGAPTYIAPTGWSNIFAESDTLELTGFGSGDYKRIAGKFDRWSGAQPGRQSFVVTATSREGDSGGGVFDSTGRLIGVRWGYNGEVYVTAGVPLSEFLWGK